MKHFNYKSSNDHWAIEGEPYESTIGGEIYLRPFLQLQELDLLENITQYYSFRYSRSLKFKYCASSLSLHFYFEPRFFFPSNFSNFLSSNFRFRSRDGRHTESFIASWIRRRRKRWWCWRRSPVEWSCKFLNFQFS